MIIYIKICVAACSILAIVKGYQKAKRVQKEYTINFAVFSKVWLFFDAVFTVCYLLSIFLIADTKKKNIVETILLAVMILLYILSVLFNQWYIDINDEKVECRSLTGRKSTCCFDQITKAEIDEANNICLYSEDRLAMKISAEIGKEYFDMILRCHDVDITYKYKIDDFVMRLPMFYPIMYLSCLVIACLFAFLSMEDHYSVGIWFWLAIALVSGYKSISGFLDRVIVKNNTITQTRFLRGPQKIECGQVVKVVQRMRNNAPYYYIYSQKGVELKINMLCENRELFRELVKSRAWKVER